MEPFEKANNLLFPTSWPFSADDSSRVAPKASESGQNDQFRTRARHSKDYWTISLPMTRVLTLVQASRSFGPLTASLTLLNASWSLTTIPIFMTLTSLRIHQASQSFAPMAASLTLSDGRSQRSEFPKCPSSGANGSTNWNRPKIENRNGASEKTIIYTHFCSESLPEQVSVCP
ncbi:unnamed protein product, partial [Nesidiocoris tenuis]